MPVKVSAIAHRQASKAYVDKTFNRFTKAFPQQIWERSAEKPDILLFVSGGSEHEAIHLLHPEKFTLLLAGFHDNAFAAAMEVKAWADARNMPTQLLPLVYSESDSGKPDDATNNQLLKFIQVWKAFQSLQHKKAGLVGKVSHWLVASAVDPGLFKRQLGVELINLPWEKLPSYDNQPPDTDFMKAFHIPGKNHLKAEAGIHSFLKMIIEKYGLDALTLECFEMVNHKKVTACLSLALLNSQGIPAACEGDLASLAGMMLIQALIGEIPWMANVAAVNHESILFAHCTAPLNLLTEFRINTHFETDLSAAVQGRIEANEVTIFRLNEKLDKAFIATGRIISRPELPHACRTQTEIVMDQKDIRMLRENPLGNHHLIIPGNHPDLLHLACRIKKIDCIN